jgi:ArsR family transcriptional regulator, arsenate/arsenite/antimonite-responsive transcriptional repressor
MDPSRLTVELELKTTERTCDSTLQPRIQHSEAETYAVIFKALSHSVRVQILDLISQGGGEVCGCDIERHFDLTQPTISHHLKVLRDAGLITSESRGV